MFYGVLFNLFFLIGANHAYSEEFLVRVDQVRLMDLKKSGSHVIVGNPSIADVSIQNSKLLVITGKSFGSTNVIVLGPDRKIITNTTIGVVNDDRRVVSLYKGSDRESYNCSPKCQSILVIGDQGEYFQNNQKAASGKSSLANSNAENGENAQ